MDFKEVGSPVSAAEMVRILDSVRISYHFSKVGPKVRIFNIWSELGPILHTLADFLFYPLPQIFSFTHSIFPK